jgi:DNA-directed RNA polymerase subunit N (RpoN/RPB10)
MLVPLLAFSCGFMLSLVWARCISSITEKRAFTAANFGVLLYLCSAASTVLIVEKQFIPILAYVIGDWVGTYIAVRKGR